MKNLQQFSKNALRLYPEKEVEKICIRLRSILAKQLKRRSIVVAISGEIDSSVTASIAVKAFGPDRVFGLLMPESHSDKDTLPLSKLLAEKLGIKSLGQVKSNLNKILD